MSKMTLLLLPELYVYNHLYCYEIVIYFVPLMPLLLSSSINIKIVKQPSSTPKCFENFKKCYKLLAYYTKYSYLHTYEFLHWSK